MIAVENILELDAQQQRQLTEDLASVGITSQAAVQNVFVTNIDGDLKNTLGHQLRVRKNTLIFGQSGWGKSQIVEQVAEELGYELVKLTASTKVPEDFGGRPMGNTENLSPELRRAIANRNIANRKAQQLFKEEIEKKEKQIGVKLGSAGKNQLFQKLISEQVVTEEEIDEEINNSNEVTRERKREVYAAPDWVYKILDDYMSKGKRTVLFLDEINQAAAETLNTLFQLVDTGKFADRREYDMSKAIVCVAAGNFRRENHSLVKLPAPLVRRFPTVIYYLGDWGVAVDYLQSKYSHNEKLVKLLEDIRLGSLVQIQSQITTGMNDFENPATLEAAIKDLNESMEENLYIANYKQIIRIPGKSQQLIDQFIRKNGLDDPTRVGGPQDGATLDTAQHYGDEEGTSSNYIAQINRVKKLWKDFGSVKRVLIKDKEGATKILFYTKPDHQQIYLDYLKAQEEYKDVPEDIWDILATSAPQDMGEWN